MRRNLVQDILFKHSNEHLEDIVEQFRQGRTCIKTQLELTIMMQVRIDWFAKMEDQITESQMDEFIGFRDEQM